MDLSNLFRSNGSNKPKKRIGRGIGSGKGGHTAGRGNKGQKARAGSHKPWPGFEGGQVPLYKRLPQIKGFSVHGKIKPAIISLGALSVFKAGEVVTPKLLLQKRLIQSLPKLGVKILSKGTLKHKIILKGFTFSKSAKKIIEKLNA